MIAVAERPAMDMGTQGWALITTIATTSLALLGALLRSRAKNSELREQVRAEEERAELAREAELRAAVLGRLATMDVRVSSLEAQLEAARERERELTVELAGLRAEVAAQQTMREQAERRAEALARELAEVRRDLATVRSDAPPPMGRRR